MATHSLQGHKEQHEDEENRQKPQMMQIIWAYNVLLKYAQQRGMIKVRGVAYVIKPGKGKNVLVQNEEGKKWQV
jgi:hypothetical protein